MLRSRGHDKEIQLNKEDRLKVFLLQTLPQTFAEFSRYFLIFIKGKKAREIVIV